MALRKSPVDTWLNAARDLSESSTPSAACSTLTNGTGFRLLWMADIFEFTQQSFPACMNSYICTFEVCEVCICAAKCYHRPDRLGLFIGRTTLHMQAALCSRCRPPLWRKMYVVLMLLQCRQSSVLQACALHKVNGQVQIAASCMLWLHQLCMSTLVKQLLLCHIQHAMANAQTLQCQTEHFASVNAGRELTQTGRYHSWAVWQLTSTVQSMPGKLRSGSPQQPLPGMQNLPSQMWCILLLIMSP